MDGMDLQHVARSHAERLPAASLYTFEPGWDAARVHGRWFMLLTEVPRGSRVRDAAVLAGRRVVIVKAAPSDAASLREAYPDIVAGYHMNKQHWITLAPGGTLERSLVEELVADSYRLVVASLPLARRPVDPETFG